MMADNGSGSTGEEDKREEGSQSLSELACPLCCPRTAPTQGAGGPLDPQRRSHCASDVPRCRRRLLCEPRTFATIRSSVMGLHPTSHHFLVESPCHRHHLLYLSPLISTPSSFLELTPYSAQTSSHSDSELSKVLEATRQRLYRLRLSRTLCPSSQLRSLPLDRLSLSLSLIIS